MANELNTVTIDGITQSLESYNTQKAQEAMKAASNDSLGKDAFLQLLVTQLKYQDPLEPQDNSNFIAQLAQFSSLEQMSNVASGLEDLAKLVGNIDTSVLVGQLSSMIGKNVTWNETTVDESGTVTNVESKDGDVTGVSIVDGAPKIMVKSGDAVYQVDASNITSIDTTKTVAS